MTDAYEFTIVCYPKIIVSHYWRGRDGQPEGAFWGADLIMVVCDKGDRYQARVDGGDPGDEDPS